jgi:DNA-binding response OmpR family regulator
MSRILIVEDEAHLANGLRFNLEAESHTVKVVPDGEGALGVLLAKRDLRWRRNCARQRTLSLC